MQYGLYLQHYLTTKLTVESCFHYLNNTDTELLPIQAL